MAQLTERYWKRLRPGQDGHVFLFALGAGLVPALAASLLLWIHAYPARVQWTLNVAMALFCFSFAWSARKAVAGPLRTAANLLEAMREGDYSIRGRVLNAEEPFGELMLQVNTMAATLQAQRLGALEATALLRKVMEEIDVAAFAFDPSQTLRLVNRAGERLLSQPAERLLARDATSLGLGEYLTGENEHTIQRAFPGGSGRWGIRRSSFREGGLPHQLLVVTDLTRPLREQELQAWQRLVRVLGHELNNSLTPIKSIAQSLEQLVKTKPLPDDWAEDTSRGLNVIATRSESLSRFLSSYAQLAKLPAPRLGMLQLTPLLNRVASLETRKLVLFEQPPEMVIAGDADQLEQALINLIRNATDAAMETGGRVWVRVNRTAAEVQIVVRDEGPGLANTANLFVPFFTTKRGGSGIGLVLSRQIAEGHGGSLTLRNAAEGRGCEACLTLPALSSGEKAD